MSKLLRVNEESQAEYIPRLTSAGIRGNPYWYSRNPFYQAGYGLPNCTCYAWGRFWENSDINADFSNRPTLSLGNARDWFGHTSDGYERGNIPALGAVACYNNPRGGHVAIVEEIHDNYLLVSESGYNSFYFRTSRIGVDGDYWPMADDVFQGFIYNPITGGGGWLYKRPWLWKKELYNREQWLIR